MVSAGMVVKHFELCVCVLVCTHEYWVAELNVFF